MRLLLIDDDERFVTLVGSILVEDGFEVTICTDPQRALAEVAAHDPQVVVLDQVMPGLDGLDVARHIRSVRPGQAIVIFSSLFDPRLSGEAERLGYRYVEKADGVEALESAINRASAGG